MHRASRGDDIQPKGLMIYTAHSAVMIYSLWRDILVKADEIHAKADDIPLLSQWIKKSKSYDLDILGFLGKVMPSISFISFTVKCFWQLGHSNSSQVN